MNPNFWTAEDDELLKEQWGKIHINELAKMLKRTNGAIRNRVYAISIGSGKNRSWTWKDDAKLNKLLKKGLDIDKIAFQLERPASAVLSRVNWLKVNEPKHAPITKKYNPSKLRLIDLYVIQFSGYHQNIICNYSRALNSFYFWGGLQFDNVKLNEFGVFVPKGLSELEGEPMGKIQESKLKLVKENGVSYLKYNEIALITFKKKSIELNEIPEIGIARGTNGRVYVNNFDRIQGA